MENGKEIQEFRIGATCDKCNTVKNQKFILAFSKKM